MGGLQFPTPTLLSASFPATPSFLEENHKMSHDVDFLERLLDASGPSGFEMAPARLWREEAESFAEEVWTDVTGNSVASLNPDGRPRVMMAGHIDEIGLQVGIPRSW